MSTIEKEQELRPEIEAEQHVNKYDTEKQTPPSTTDDGKQPIELDDHIYPSGLRLALILTSIYIGMFLVALVCEQATGISTT